MSTTRWIIETSCEHGWFKKHVTEYDPAGNTWCSRPPNIVVDPDNLPPEAIEKVANALANIAYNRGWPSEHPNDLLVVAEAAVTAFLSDPEPGDQ